LASKKDSKNVSADATAKGQYTSTGNGFSLDHHHAAHSGNRLLIHEMQA
jgi:hypothetical protein